MDSYGTFLHLIKAELIVSEVVPLRNVVGVQLSSDANKPWTLDVWVEDQGACELHRFAMEDGRWAGPV